MDLIEFKSWDSEFFGLKTGKINSELPLTSEIVSLLREETKNKGYQFLYYFPPSSVQLKSQPDIKVLSELGFEYIDHHGTLLLDLEKLPFPQPSSIPFFSISSPNECNYVQLKKLVQQLSVLSRFYLDQKIPREKVKELYDLWIDRSFNGPMGDYVYIIGSKENPLGFVTYKKLNEEEIDLPLIAISEEERGKGSGKILVLSSLNQLKKQFKRCSVKVSLGNVNAVRFYESLGFRLQESHQVFHAHIIPKNVA